MDYSKKKKDELITICKENGIKGYSRKKKSELVELLSTQANKVKGVDKISKKKCSICKKEGHNKSSCNTQVLTTKIDQQVEYKKKVPLSTEYTNIEKLNELCKSFVGEKIHITSSFKGHSLLIINPNLIGDILEDIFYPSYKSTCPDFREGPKQESPDYFGMNDFRFEQKAFIGSPGFDISNFTSFVTQISKPGCLVNKIFRTKYLVYEYGMESDAFVIKNFWMLNIWNLPTYGNTYPISMQVKKKMWYNIRPGTHKSWNDEKKTAEMFLNYLLKCIKVCPHIEDKESLTLSIITQMEEARSQGLL